MQTGELDNILVGLKTLLSFSRYTRLRARAVHRPRARAVSQRAWLRNHLMSTHDWRNIPFHCGIPLWDVNYIWTLMANVSWYEVTLDTMKRKIIDEKHFTYQKCSSLTYLQISSAIIGDKLRSIELEMQLCLHFI